MVYMTPEELGWRPAVKTWIHTFFEDEAILTNELKEFLYATFDATIDVGLEKIKEHFAEPVPTVDL
jgi:hypothetical protein